MYRSTPPVELGQVLPVVIDTAGPSGQGLVHLDDFIIFVHEAKVGEKVKVKITHLARTYAEAKKV